jgi:hypothetical protein
VTVVDYVSLGRCVSTIATSPFACYLPPAADSVEGGCQHSLTRWEVFFVLFFLCCLDGVSNHSISRDSTTSAFMLAWSAVASSLSPGGPSQRSPAGRLWAWITALLTYFTLHAPPNKDWEPQSGSRQQKGLSHSQGCYKQVLLPAPSHQVVHVHITSREAVCMDYLVKVCCMCYNKL